MKSGMLQQVIGYWFSEKKANSCKIDEITEACLKKNMKIVKIDLQSPLENQGPFHLIFHKLTYLYALAQMGDVHASETLNMFQEYSIRHPEVVIMDPLDSVHILLLRDQTYSKIQQVTRTEEKISTPSFVKITSTEPNDIEARLQEGNITFPVVCKPVCGGGGKAAHELAVVFHKESIVDFGVPCIVQSFVNHSAVLYKLWVIGHNFHFDLRPSLKNFFAGAYPPVYFNTHEVSKSHSCSPLTKLSPSISNTLIAPDPEILQRVVQVVRKAFNMDLVGIDLVIDQNSGKYFIIDINPYPSYDSVPNFEQSLVDLFYQRLKGGPHTHYKLRCEIPQSLDPLHLQTKLDEHLAKRNEQQTSEILPNAEKSKHIQAKLFLLNSTWVDPSESLELTNGKDMLLESLTNDDQTKCVQNTLCSLNISNKSEELANGTNDYSETHNHRSQSKNVSLISEG